MRTSLWFLLIFFQSLALLADQTDKFIREQMQSHDIPGLAVAVVQGEKRIKTGVYGYANLEWKIPVTRETVFEIGSVTKQFTAAGIMLLVQDGKLNLDDKISQHLKNTPATWNGVTIRHLLTHTSGIKSYTGLDGYEYTKHLTEEQFIAQIGRLPLEFQPGESWKYCNTGFNLLGFIIENVSGKKYWDFMSSRIFVPVGMNSTTNRNPGTIISCRASGYEKDRQGRRINRDYDLTDVFSAGEIVSTLDDMARWDAALNTDKILSAASKAEMWSPAKLNNGKTKAYGLAWFVDEYKGHKNIGHSGSTSGFSATFLRFPDDELTVILFCNSGEDGIATSIAKKLAEFYFKRIPGPTAQAETAK